MKAEELRLEEFARWMRAWGYSESTIKKVISDLKAYDREGLNSLSKYTRLHRRYAYRLYQRFLYLSS